MIDHDRNSLEDSLLEDGGATDAGYSRGNEGGLVEMPNITIGSTNTKPKEAIKAIVPNFDEMTAEEAEELCS